MYVVELLFLKLANLAVQIWDLRDVKEAIRFQYSMDLLKFSSWIQEMFERREEPYNVERAFWILQGLERSMDNREAMILGYADCSLRGIDAACLPSAIKSS